MTQQAQHQAAKYTAKYAAIQGSYWPIFCSSYSFASVFLLSRNFDNSEIGIVLALANIFAVFLQPTVAVYADTTKKISLKNLTALLALAAAMLTGVRCLIPNVLSVLAVLLVLELTILFSLQPLISALGMHMINRGVKINFGFARGLGSLSFAVCSYIVGVLIERFGPEASPVVSVCCFVILIFFVYTFTNEKRGKGSETEGTNFTENEITQDETVQEEITRNETEKQASGMMEFVKKYKQFILLLLAIAFTFTSHSMINNYFIQITNDVGGNTKDMGFGIGLAAAIELPAMMLFTHLVRKVRCSTILKSSFLFFLVKAVLTMTAPNMFVLDFAQVFQFAAYAMFIPASIYYVNQIIKEEDLVKGQAFVTGAITLGGVSASLLGGWLLDAYGVSSMLNVGSIATIIGLVIALLAIQKTATAD